MRRYTIWSFIGDCIMLCLTGGLWLLFIIVREIRNVKA